MSRLNELRTAIGTPSEAAAKTLGFARTVIALLNGRERRRRLQRLYDTDTVDVIPTNWQLVQGAWRMYVDFILPTNVQFYAHYEVDHHWHQLLRVLDAPDTMIDPIGLGLSLDTLVTHMVQVVHTSIGYDMALLEMWDDGFDRLEEELVLVISGTHPRQEAIEALLEKPGYPELLLQALTRYREDPVANWRCDTFDAPEDCQDAFEAGVALYGSPRLLFRQCATYPPTVWDSLRARARGAHPAPSPTLR